MIRNNANLIKWTSYALAFLLVFFFECCVLNRFPLHGAIPNLSILVVVAVALFEGSINGAIFGLVIGFFCSAVYYRSGLMMIPIYTIIGACTGATRKEKIGRSLLGCAVCSLGRCAASCNYRCAFRCKRTWRHRKFFSAGRSAVERR